jgi:hypothetical protein
VKFAVGYALVNRVRFAHILVMLAKANTLASLLTRNDAKLSQMRQFEMHPASTLKMKLNGKINKL